MLLKTMKKNNEKEQWKRSLLAQYNFGCKFKPAKNKLVLEKRMQYDEKDKKNTE